MKLLALGCAEPNDPERLTAASRDGWWAEVRDDGCGYQPTGKRVEKIANRVIGYMGPGREEVYGPDAESWCVFIWEGPTT